MGGGVSRPYVSLGVIAAGLIIAYHSYSDYRAMDGVEVAGLFVFGVAFAGALALKLLVADKFDANAASDEHEHSHEPAGPGNGEETEAGGSDN